MIMMMTTLLLLIIIFITKFLFVHNNINEKYLVDSN